MQKGLHSSQISQKRALLALCIVYSMVSWLFRMCNQLPHWQMQKMLSAKSNFNFRSHFCFLPFFLFSFHLQEGPCSSVQKKTKEKRFRFWAALLAHRCAARIPWAPSGNSRKSALQFFCMLKQAATYVLRMSIAQVVLVEQHHLLARRCAAWIVWVLSRNSRKSAILWQFPLKMLRSQRPPHRETHISQYLAAQIEIKTLG